MVRRVRWALSARDGQATIEWAGVAVVVAMLLAVVIAFAPGLGASISHEISCAVDTVMHEPCATPSGLTPAQAYQKAENLAQQICMPGDDGHPECDSRYVSDRSAIDHALLNGQPLSGLKLEGPINHGPGYDPTDPGILGLGFGSNDAAIKIVVGDPGHNPVDAVSDALLVLPVGEIVDALKGLDALRGVFRGTSEEEKALQTAIDDGRVSATAPANHLKGAIGEELGWQESLKDGQIGVQGPGKVAATGPDYITFDPESDQILVWDAKFSTAGRFPASLSPAKLRAWMPSVISAVAHYSGPDATAIKQALASGRVDGQLFKYTPPK